MDLGMVHGTSWAFYFMQAEAILRSGEGTSSQLEGILKYIDEHTEEKLRANAERRIAWVQFRAADADR